MLLYTTICAGGEIGGVKAQPKKKKKKKTSAVPRLADDSWVPFCNVNMIWNHTRSSHNFLFFSLTCLSPFTPSCTMYEKKKKGLSPRGLQISKERQCSHLACFIAIEFDPFYFCIHTKRMNSVPNDQIKYHLRLCQRLYLLVNLSSLSLSLIFMSRLKGQWQCTELWILKSRKKKKGD